MQHDLRPVDTRHSSLSAVLKQLGLERHFTLNAGLLATGQYSEGPATGHLDTGFFLVSLCPKANAEMVPNIPSCHYMLLM